MKYFKTLIVLCLVGIMLSGCSFRMASSIDDLIAPLSPFGNNADIKGALDAYVKNGYSLKTPNIGKHITSYTFFDINEDGVEEAVAFYEPSDNLATIDMAIIGKYEKGWKVFVNIQGEGKDVSSLDFEDVNGDGKKEILVCWDVISNSSNHQLCIYTYKYVAGEGTAKLKRLHKSITVNNYLAVNLVQDATPELLLFEMNSGSTQSAKAMLYSAKDNRMRLLGETKLDSHITAYQNLQAEQAENEVRIYADALGSDGSSMLTEILYWSKKYNSVVSPFYSYYTGRTKGTSRSFLLASGDINEDGRVEIPVDYKKIKNLPPEVKAVDWKYYNKTVLMHAQYALFAVNDRYVILLPDNVLQQIQVAYNTDTREMTVILQENGKVIFSVVPVLKAVYNENTYSDYLLMLEASGYCYLVKMGEETSLGITQDMLKQSIKSVG